MSDHIAKQFPDLILSNILTRLPTKSICRFKLVSKRWNFLISHPNFLTSYISLNPPTWHILDRVIKLDISDSPDSAIRLNSNTPPKITTLLVDIDRLAVEPVPGPTDGHKHPSIVGSSNGLILLMLVQERDPHDKHKRKPSPILWAYQGPFFVVANPLTLQWTPLPFPPKQPLNESIFTCPGTVAFVTRPNPITCKSSPVTCEVVVAVYQPDLITRSGSAIILCFSSKTGEWVEKKSNYMLGSHIWQCDGAFEFGGRLFWVNHSVGLITWDEDIFSALSKKKQNNRAMCRYIPLPKKSVRKENKPVIVFKRWIGVNGGGVGGSIQYVEADEEKKCTSVWKLKDYKKKDGGGWSLLYKMEFSKDGPGRGRVPTPCFVDPFVADVVYFVVGGWVSVLNCKTNEVTSRKGGDSCLGEVLLQSFVVPSWPVFLSPRFCADQWKELGNQFFKSNLITDAICYYSKSISYSPSPTAYANRGIAHMKLKRFSEAEDDCTQALNLDADYLKVYVRRAAARKSLGNLAGSMEDLEAALKLDPQDEALKAQHAEVKSLVEKTSMQNVDIISKMEQLKCTGRTANHPADSISSADRQS